MTLIDNVKKHEGFRSKAYVCPAGKLTIGYGTNIEDGISQEEATLLLEYRLNNAMIDVDLFFGYEDIRKLSDIQQDALYELAYWIGMPTFQKFKNMIKAIKDGDYIKASEELLDSKLGREYNTRATELANKLRG